MGVTTLAPVVVLKIMWDDVQKPRHIQYSICHIIITDVLDFSKSPTPKSSCLLDIHVSRALESRTPLILRLQLKAEKPE